MADIQLSRPAANQTQTVTSAADARFVLNFATGEAKLAKSDNGENLILTFDDGARIEIEGFYTAFNKDNLPTLNVGGQDFTGDQLTAILGEDLMPAAGPASSGPASAGGSNATFANFSLDEGIDRIGGLDIGFSDAANLENTLEGAGVFPSPSGTVAAAGGVTPEATPEPEPIVNNLIAQDDPHSEGVMNSLSIGNFIDLSNDNLGSVKTTAIAGIGAPRNSLPTGVNAEYDSANNALNLTLDGAALEAALYGDRTVDNIIQRIDDQDVNIARHVKPVGGKFELDYTSQDATGAYTGTATATFDGVNTGTMSGGDGSDVAWATGNTGIIDTGGSADLVVAASNSGTIEGGVGSDRIYVGSSDGRVDGGGDNDKINVSGTNKGTIDGGAGDDVITVYENARIINGGAGNDTIDVVEGVGDNTLLGGDDKDWIALRGGSAYLDGGEGDDTVKAQGDNDEHRWSKDWAKYTPETNPNIALAEANDAHHATLVGGAGHDKVQASDVAHHNVLYGDDPNDPTIVGNDNIQIFDLAHDNTAYGGGGADTIQIFRRAHHNEVFGGDDDFTDHLIVQDMANNNTLWGGMGDDLLEAKGQGGTFYDGEINDSVWGTAYNNKLYGGEGNDTLIAISGAQNNLLDGGKGNDSLVVDDTWKDITQYGLSSKHYDTTGNTLTGGEGDDTLTAQNGATKNTLEGGEDDDELYVQSGATGNFLYGDDGADKLYASGAGTDGNFLYGGDGADEMSVYGGAKRNKLFGGDDDAKDELYASGTGTDDNSLYGGAGNDELKVSHEAKGNSLEGGAGNDTLKASDGAKGNVLHGNEDNDVLEVWGGNAGTSSNKLYGDAGDDLFRVQDSSKLFDTNDNTLDGGSGFDVLVERGDDGVLKNLTTDKLKEFIDDGKINNIEAIVTKGGDKINSVDDLLNKGWTVDSEGNIQFGAGWHKDAEGFTTEAGVTYTQYHHDDGTTVLMAQQLIDNQGG